MSVVDSRLSSAQIALKLVSQPAASEKAAAEKSDADKAATGAEPGGASLSPAVHDALFNLSWSVRRSDAAIPAEHLARLGAGTWALREPDPMSDEELRSVVLSQYRDADDEALRAAATNGTMTVQRASDVAGLEYKSYLYDQYRDGHAVGSIGWNEGSGKDFLKAQRAAGINAGVGSINGNDYYITWP